MAAVTGLIQVSLIRWEMTGQDEAHLHGIPVTADSFGEFTQWAAEAGIDSIEHPLNLNKEVISAMAQNKTDLVPTITAFYNVLNHKLHQRFSVIARTSQVD